MKILIDNKEVRREDYTDEQWEGMIVNFDSIIRIEELSLQEIIERFGDTLTPEQKQSLNLK